MKAMKKALALVLALAMVLSMCTFAGAEEQPVPSQYAEAVELFSNMKVGDNTVIDALNGADLNGYATRNDVAALTAVLNREGRIWSPVENDYDVTGGEMCLMYDSLLCTYDWFQGAKEFDAYLHRFLAGFEEDWASFSARTVTRAEALQVLMNAMTATVRYGDTWSFGGEFGLAQDLSNDPSVTDAFGAPARRWWQNGVQLTDWHVMPALYTGSGSTSTHDVLTKCGIIDFSESDGFSNNCWAEMNLYVNGSPLWTCYKLHWGHPTGDGCQQNLLCDHTNSTMRVYSMGKADRSVPDDGGKTNNCEIFIVTYEEAPDEIEYTEAVELFSNFRVNDVPVINSLGGKLLGGKAKQSITRNEAAALINALAREGRTWGTVEQDFYVTGKQYCLLVDALLCTYNWYSDCKYYDAYLNNYLTGLNCTWDEIKDRQITREEAVQILMNALDGRVQAGQTWLLREEFGLYTEVSADDSVTDAFGRPVRRWMKNGTPVTGWHAAPAVFTNETSITDHEILERLGIFIHDGGVQNNQWCRFDVVENGNNKWSAFKCHWGHGNDNSDMTNALTYRFGSTYEVYFKGFENCYVPDAGGNADCRVYQVVVKDTYLSKIENKTISIYNNTDNPVWSWNDSRLPAEDGYYIINLSFKGDATAYPVCKAASYFSSQQGMALPAGDGNNYVWTNQGKCVLSRNCALGLHGIIDSIEYYNNGKTVQFFCDQYGRVIGAIQPSFAVTVNEPENGTLSADKTAAFEGETVTLTAAPADGYKIDKVKVGENELTVDANGQATFTMPGGDVTVSATFVQSISYQATVALGESIDVNFYVNGVPQEDTLTDYTVTATLGGKTVYTGTLADAELVDPDANDFCMTIAGVAAYQIYQPITITVSYQSSTIKTVGDFSVKQYCLTKIAENKDAELVTLCKALLDYGANAQLYFTGKTFAGAEGQEEYATDPEHLANADTNPTNDLSAAVKPTAKGSVKGGVSGVSGLYATLLLRSETGIKLYFNCSEETAALLTVTASHNDAPVAIEGPIKDSDGKYFVRLNSIAAYAMGDDYVFTFTKGQQQMDVTFSAFAYAAASWDNAEIGDLVKSIVAYTDAAAAYFG